MDCEVVQSVLNEFFELTESGYRNHRADLEISDYHDYLAKQKANGLKGGRPKKTQLKPTVNPDLTQNNPKQEPLTTNHSITPIGFDLFWNSYNKKVGKPNSLKAWSKMNLCMELNLRKTDIK
jgi:uncharacterized protein YdaU (DUF1376 family)